MRMCGTVPTTNVCIMMSWKIHVSDFVQICGNLSEYISVKSVEAFWHEKLHCFGECRTFLGNDTDFHDNGNQKHCATTLCVWEARGGLVNLWEVYWSNFSSGRLRENLVGKLATFERFRSSGKEEAGTGGHGKKKSRKKSPANHSFDQSCFKTTQCIGFYVRAGSRTKVGHTHAAPIDRPRPLVPVRIKYLVLNFPVKKGLNTLVVNLQ